MSFFTLIAIVLVAGVLAWLIKKAPFIDEPYKAFALWVLLAFVVIYILFCFVGPFPDVRIPGRR